MFPLWETVNIICHDLKVAIVSKNKNAGDIKITDIS